MDDLILNQVLELDSGDQLGIQLENRLWGQFRIQLCDQLSIGLWNLLDNQLKNHLKNQLLDQLKESIQNG